MGWNISQADLKLLQKSQIAGKQASDVVDLMQHHRKALDPESCGKPAVNLGIIACAFQDVGIDHATSQNF